MQRTCLTSRLTSTRSRPIRGGIGQSPRRRYRGEAGIGSTSDDRFAIPLEGVSVLFGQPSQLTVRLDGPPVLQFFATEKLSYRNEKGELVSSDVLNLATLEHRGDGTPYIQLTARQTHRTEYSFYLLFADGGVATKTIKIPVTLSPEPPRRLISSEVDNNMENSGGCSVMVETTLHMLAAGAMRRRTLTPCVTYSLKSLFVPLLPSDVAFTVNPAGSTPVIDLDKTTGVITALQPGQALIETSFAGATMETCVVVMADMADGESSNCKELRFATVQNR